MSPSESRRASSSTPDPVLKPYKKSALTRQRILDATAEVLSSRGYAGTRLVEIAELAQVQTPAIYYYFDSREDLIEEVMWWGTHRMREGVQETIRGLDALSDPIDRICVLVDAHIRSVLSVSAYGTAAIRNAGQLPPQISARMRQEQADYDEVWRDLFTEAARAGRFKPGVDLRAARMLVLGALNWSTEWWKPELGGLDDVVTTVQMMVRGGLAADDPAES